VVNLALDEPQVVHTEGVTVVGLLGGGPRSIRSAITWGRPSPWGAAPRHSDVDISVGRFVGETPAQPQRPVLGYSHAD
jgi:hypothetical protein